MLRLRKPNSSLLDDCSCCVDVSRVSSLFSSNPADDNGDVQPRLCTVSCFSSSEMSITKGSSDVRRKKLSSEVEPFKSDMFEPDVACCGGSSSLKAGYLIKWKSHSKWHCTLEPKRNLTQACLHEFQNPSKPFKHRLKAASEEVLYAIQKKLFNSRRSSGVAQVNVDQDIFR
ncbi:hypothetical protein MRX96_014442 [Rhipicephalus microplus]